VYEDVQEVKKCFNNQFSRIKIGGITENTMFLVSHLSHPQMKENSRLIHSDRATNEKNSQKSILDSHSSNQVHLPEQAHT
jgi:hypothetical protein